MPRDFTITAGNAFFDHTPVIGEVCIFDFGDPKGPYNVLTGFNAAHIYQTPGTYKLKVTRTGTPPSIKTIHVLPDHRGIQRMEPHDRLFDVIRGLRNDTVVLLSPGITYDLPGPIEIKARNIEFRAAGPGPMPRIKRLASNGSSCLIVSGLDVTFRGIEFDSDRDIATVGNGKVNYRCITPDGGHVVVVDCEFHNYDDGVFCTPMTRGVLIQWCKFSDDMRSCDLWVDGTDLVVLGNTMLTSQREHNIRSTYPHFYNLLVYDNDITATHNKETLTFRCGQDLYAARNIFRTGWVRTGPGPRGDNRPMTPDEVSKAYARHVVIDRNAFLEGSWMQVNESSSDITVRYNRFDDDRKGCPVHVAGPSINQLLVDENYRVLTNGPTPKPFIRALQIEANNVVERGTTTKGMDEADRLKGK